MLLNSPSILQQILSKNAVDMYFHLFGNKGKMGTL